MDRSEEMSQTQAGRNHQELYRLLNQAETQNDGSYALIFATAYAVFGIAHGQPPEGTTIEDIHKALSIVDQIISQGNYAPHLKDGLIATANYIRQEWLHEEVAAHG